MTQQEHPSNTRRMAQELLKIAEGMNDPWLLEAPFLAVARVLKQQGHAVSAFCKTIEHSSGLISCVALVVDEDSQSPIGPGGLDTWSAILKAAIKQKGYRGGKFLGVGQEINPMPNNEFLEPHQAQIVQDIADVLVSHQQAAQLDQITIRATGKTVRHGI